MNYDEFMKRVLCGKSVNARAQELGIPQKTLNNYVSGRSAPGCAMTKMLAEVAGVPLSKAVEAVAEQELRVRPMHSSSFLRPAVASVLVAIVGVTNFLTVPTENSPAFKQLADSGERALYIM